MTLWDFSFYQNPPGVGRGFTPIRINSRKAPLDTGWNTNPPSLEFDNSTLYGMMPPPEILVIDVDVKNGAQGEESWQQLLKDLYSKEDLKNPCKYPSVPNVVTPSGGFHFYIRLEGIDHHDIPKSNPRYPGIDFITHGKSQVVAGGQTLDNGEYVLKNYCIHNTLPSYDTIIIKKTTQTPKKPLDFTRQQIQSLLDYIPSDDYEVWHKVAWCLMGSNLSKEEAKSIWIEWSSTSSKYSPLDCESKWQEHLDTYGHNETPLTIASLVYYARQYSPDKALEINDILHPPLGLEGRFCHVQSINSTACYFDLKTQAWCKQELVKAVLRPLLLKRGDAVDKKEAKLQDLIDLGDIHTPHDIVYAPGKPYPLFTNENGKVFLNTYSTDTVPTPLPFTTPLNGSLGHYIQHVHQIFGKYAPDFLDFIAYLVQNPGKKIRYCLVLEGGKGTGKGLILEAIKTHVLGYSNCRIITTTQICSEYNGWAFDKQLIHIDELLINGLDSRQVMDRLKTIISENVVPRNEKYMKSTELPCLASFIALTNHKDCLKDADNRRYHAIISPIRNKGDIKLGNFKSIEDYYNALIDFASPDNLEGGQLRSYFLEYTISPSFNPGERPQESDFDRIQEMSRTANSEYSDYTDLIKYIYKTDTLPQYICMRLVCSRSTETNPDYGTPFFDEALTIKQLKRFGKYMQYTAYSGFLYSNEINIDKAKERIRILRRTTPTS